MSWLTRATGLAEARELLSRPWSGEELRHPVVAVDVVAGADNAPGDLTELIAATPAVVVAVLHPDALAEADAQTTEGLAGFDIVLSADGQPDPLGVSAEVAPGGVDAVAEAVAASPQAALTLAQLLRLSSGGDTADGLVAESLAYSTLQYGAQFRDWLTEQPPRRESEQSDPVLAERAGSLLHITLNAPQHRNALNTAMRDRLVELLRSAWLDLSLDGILLDGAGPVFCAGGDLAEFGTTPDPATAHVVRSVRSVALWMDRVAARTRVVVHGGCVGAGVELPAYAHEVVARPGATFRLPEVQMGLVPGAGGTVSIARRVGRQRCCWLALTGTELDCATALRWGLIDRIEAA